MIDCDAVDSGPNFAVEAVLMDDDGWPQPVNLKGRFL